MSHKRKRDPLSDLRDDDPEATAELLEELTEEADGD